jgi:peptidoglycan/LPS O-acetylase OafA/YrhL
MTNYGKTMIALPENKPNYRVFGSFRFLLALMVVLSHTWELNFETPSEHFIYQIGLGNIAVMGFFMLSGYIIAEAVNIFYPGRHFAFLVNRFFRLAPPYWGALAVSLITHYVLARFGVLRMPDYPVPPSDMFTPGNLAVNLTDIFPVLNFNQILPAHSYYSFVRYAWAIRVEMAFYCATFAVCWLAATARLSLRWLTIAAVSGFLLVHITNEYVRHLHWFFGYVPYFCCGVGLYFWQVRRDPLALAGVVVSYGLLVLHFSGYTQDQHPFSAEWLDGLKRVSVELPLAITAFIPIVLFALSKMMVSARAKAIDQALGNLSYPLYLNHYPVLVIFLSLGWVGPVAQCAILLGAVALSAVMKTLIEAPMTPLRNRLRGMALN